MQRDDVLHALVAELDGAVVGFAHYRSHPDTFTAGRDWFLDDLYVAAGCPRLRRRRRRSSTHRRTRARERRAGTLRWITAADNERAQRVYDRVATKTTWVTYEVRP